MEHYKIGNKKYKINSLTHFYLSLQNVFDIKLISATNNDNKKNPPVCTFGYKLLHISFRDI